MPRQQILLSLVQETLRENVVQKFFNKKSLTITNIIDMGGPILNEKLNPDMHTFKLTDYSKH